MVPPILLCCFVSCWAKISTSLSSFYLCNRDLPCASSLVLENNEIFLFHTEIAVNLTWNLTMFLRRHRGLLQAVLVLISFVVILRYSYTYYKDTSSELKAANIRHHELLEERNRFSRELEGKFNVINTFTKTKLIIYISNCVTLMTNLLTILIHKICIHGKQKWVVKF